MSYRVEFEGTLHGGVGPGAWTFVDVPPELAPSAAGPWGRIPVRAAVDGRAWGTSVWREKSGRVLLPLPKKIGNRKTAGDAVRVELEFSSFGG